MEMQLILYDRSELYPVSRPFSQYWLQPAGEAGTANRGMDGWINGWMCSVLLTNVSEDGGHCVCSSLVAGQATIHSSILFVHVPYNQCAVRSHPVSGHASFTIQYVYSFSIIKKNKQKHVIAGT